jgi:hypothetical protein
LPVAHQVATGDPLPQRPLIIRSVLRENLTNHFALHIGQSELAALKAVGQSLVIDLEQLPI